MSSSSDKYGRDWYERQNATLGGQPGGHRATPGSRATNAGAYKEVELEIKTVQREQPHLSLKNATIIARERVEQRARNGLIKKTDAEERREYMGAPTKELMMPGAKPSGGSSPQQKRRKKPPKRKIKVCSGMERHPQTSDVEVCTECGSLIEKLEKTKEAKLQPALWRFSQNCKKEGLHPRHVIAFWLCTPYATREVLDGVVSQMQDFVLIARDARQEQLAARKRNRDRRLKLKQGDVGLFGEWPGTREPMRLPTSMEHSLAALGVRLAPIPEGTSAVEPYTLNHVANTAYGVYLEYLKLLQPPRLNENGDVLSGVYGVTADQPVPEAGVEALATSSLYDLLTLSEWLCQGASVLNILQPHPDNGSDDELWRRHVNFYDYVTNEVDELEKKLKRKALKTGRAQENADYKRVKDGKRFNRPRRVSANSVKRDSVMRDAKQKKAIESQRRRTH